MINDHKNADSIALFSHYLASQKAGLKKQYQQLLAQDLSRQQWDGCFQRNVLVVIGQVYDDALAYVHTLPFDSKDSPVNKGLSEISKQVLASFDGFVDEFLLSVVDSHRTSCALSNFPDEHKPDNTYINAVRREIAGLWQDFALAVNAHVLEGC